jgi:hypothetical protein
VSADGRQLPIEFQFCHRMRQQRRTIVFDPILDFAALSDRGQPQRQAPSDIPPSVSAKMEASGEENVESLISDPGFGMRLDVRRRAFDPFFTMRRDQRCIGVSACPLSMPFVVHTIVRDGLGGRVSLAGE